MTGTASREKSVWGLVLAGGGSQRMGVAKAFLPLAGRTLMEHAVQRLRPFVDGVSLVVRDPQPFQHLGLPTVTDQEPDQGPLMGLYSGLEACPAPWALVVGCDTPLLKPALLQAIIDASRTSPIVVGELGGRPQPLPGLYAVSCIRDIEEMLQLGVRALRRLLAYVTPSLIAEEEVRLLDPSLLSYLDVDTPDAYEEVQRLLETSQVDSPEGYS